MSYKKIVSLALISGALLLSGCFAYGVSPVAGIIYTDVKAPIAVTSSQTQPTKKGSAEASSILGLFAFGDASVKTAAADGGITEIHHVDYQTVSFLGIYASYEVTVYGN